VWSLVRQQRKAKGSKTKRRNKGKVQFTLGEGKSFLPSKGKTSSQEKKSLGEEGEGGQQEKKGQIMKKRPLRVRAAGEKETGEPLREARERQ